MKIIVGLDWSPNTIHAGLLIAQLDGSFANAGLKVEFVSPEEDNYTCSVIDKLQQDKINISLGPSEHLLKYRLEDPEGGYTAIASLMQKDTSRIVVKKNSGITSPAQLDGKRVAIYNSHFEQQIYQNLIRNAGGAGTPIFVTPPRLSLWEAFMKDEADACWMFQSWEGANADLKGVELTEFQLGDYGIPYGYSPIMGVKKAWLETNTKAVSNFLKCCEAGYQFATYHPKETAELLKRNMKHPNMQNLQMLQHSLDILHTAFLDKNGQWGQINPQKWDAFAQWLYATELLKDSASKPKAAV